MPPTFILTLLFYYTSSVADMAPSMRDKARALNRSEEEIEEIDSHRGLVCELEMTSLGKESSAMAAIRARALLKSFLPKVRGLLHQVEGFCLPTRRNGACTRRFWRLKVCVVSQAVRTWWVCAEQAEVVLRVRGGERRLGRAHRQSEGQKPVLRAPSAAETALVAASLAFRSYSQVLPPRISERVCSSMASSSAQFGQRWCITVALEGQACHLPEGTAAPSIWMPESASRCLNTLAHLILRVPPQE